MTTIRPSRLHFGRYLSFGKAVDCVTPLLGSSQPAPKPCCDLCGGRDPPCLSPKAQATWMRSQQKRKAMLCCNRTMLAGQRHRDISAALVQGQMQVPAAAAEELLPPEELGVLITLQGILQPVCSLQKHMPRCCRITRLWADLIRNMGKGEKL